MATKVDGYLLIDKSTGWTSFDVVNKIRYVLADALGVPSRSLKVGHAGTLDPLASGLLIILAGSYTKKQANFLKLDKVYRAELRLGQTSDTDDEEGAKHQVSELQPDAETVRRQLSGFIGPRQQAPPAYSAIKVAGQPAYKRARSGRPLKLKPRPINVYELNYVSYEYPHVGFVCRVSSGTYVRALARDIGLQLGTGAYLSSLRRTKIGNYAIADALKIEELSKQTILAKLRQLS